MARRDEGGYPQRSPTKEQRSQPAFSSKTLRAAGLLPVAGVGSAVTARCGDAPASPPWPQPKSLAAGSHAIFRQALSHGGFIEGFTKSGEKFTRPATGKPPSDIVLPESPASR